MVTLVTMSGEGFARGFCQSCLNNQVPQYCETVEKNTESMELVPTTPVANASTHGSAGSNAKIGTEPCSCSPGKYLATTTPKTCAELACNTNIVEERMLDKQVNKFISHMVPVTPAN